MKFQSVSNYVTNICAVWRDIYMLVTNVICKECLNSSSGSLHKGWKHLILFVSRRIPHPSVILRLLPWSLKTYVKASFFKYRDIISCSWYKHIVSVMVLLTVTFILYNNCYCSVLQCSSWILAYVHYNSTTCYTCNTQ